MQGLRKLEEACHWRTGVVRSVATAEEARKWRPAAMHETASITRATLQLLRYCNAAVYTMSYSSLPRCSEPTNPLHSPPFPRRLAELPELVPPYLMDDDKEEL